MDFVQLFVKLRKPELTCWCCNQVKTYKQLLIFLDYSKAFEAHLLVLQELSKSGANVSEESTRFTNEISAIVSALQQINREEEKLVNICTQISK